MISCAGCRSCWSFPWKLKTLHWREEIENFSIFSTDITYEKVFMTHHFCDDITWAFANSKTRLCKVVHIENNILLRFFIPLNSLGNSFLYQSTRSFFIILDLMRMMYSPMEEIWYLSFASIMTNNSPLRQTWESKNDNLENRRS